MFEAYCDGSCKANGTSKAKAAYAFVIYEIDMNKKIEIYRECGPVLENPTNNVAEMTAMLKALDYWKENCNDTILIHCDSAYVVNAYKQHWIDNWKRNGWKTANKKDVKNKELWIKLDAYFQDKYNVILDKVEGHRGIAGNELVDSMAQGVWK